VPDRGPTQQYDRSRGAVAQDRKRSGSAHHFRSRCARLFTYPSHDNGSLHCRACVWLRECQCLTRRDDLGRSSLQFGDRLNRSCKAVSGL
jgi:hypothetical protein